MNEQNARPMTEAPHGGRSHNMAMRSFVTQSNFGSQNKVGGAGMSNKFNIQNNAGSTQLNFFSHLNSQAQSQTNDFNTLDAEEN